MRYRFPCERCNLAELVMEYVELQALSTFYPVPRWWRRYVDNSNACIKSRDLDRFHHHLNAVNPHIQFTVERTTLMDGKPTIAFLDTSLSVLLNGYISAQVYSRPHTQKSTWRLILITLIHCADTIPSKQSLKIQKARVEESLKTNGTQ